MKEYAYQEEMQVRDYECDMQGHVNNAVYLNYLEHCRHEYMKEFGLDFSRLVQRGLNLVVIRAELDYKRSLRSGEKFMIGVNLEKVSPLRYRFIQDVYLLPEKKLVLKARVLGTGVNSNGRPQLPEEIVRVFESMENHG